MKEGDYISKTIGTLIREERKKAKLTQEELGNLCGMAGSAIRRYELGKANPKLATIQKIANALNIEYKILLEEELDKPFKISNIGSRIKEEMINQSITKDELIRKYQISSKKYNADNISMADLDFIINGIVEPVEQKLLVLADVLNVNPSWLIGLDIAKERNNISDINTRLYLLDNDIDTLHKRVTFYTAFRSVISSLGYELTTNWNTIEGEDIDLIEDANYRIEVPHSIIKEIMNNSKSFIGFYLERLFQTYEKKERDKTFDNMTDEEFENYFSSEDSD